MGLWLWGPLGEPLASGRERVPYYSELRLSREPWLPAGQQQLEATQSPGRAAGSLTQLAPRQSAWPQTAWLPALAPALSLLAMSYGGRNVTVGNPMPWAWPWG